MGVLPNKKRASSHIQGPTLVEMFHLKSIVWEPHKFLEIKEQFNQRNKGTNGEVWKLERIVGELG